MTEQGETVTAKTSFIITGASGFIGRMLVPRLIARGHNLLLIGRDPMRLAALFPDLPVASYDDLPQRGCGFDVLLHLAVANNTAGLSRAEFEDANVVFFEAVIAAAKTAGVEGLINFSSFHALTPAKSDYAHSKAAALDIARATSGMAVRNLFLPAVYGDDFAGRMSVLNHVPNRLRPFALTCLAAFFPTITVDRIADYLCGLDRKSLTSGDVFLANPQRQNPVFLALKRSIDLAFSVAVFLFLGWLLALVWVAVRLSSPGAGIFAQPRIGRTGRIFTCYKFRTMRVGTRQAGTHEISSADLTGLGSFLRKTKLDELPQIWNIMRGELSLVGPRPCLPSQVELIAQRQLHGVLDAMPGITGLAQINGVDMRDPAKLAALDARYLAQQSISFDLKIIIATFLGRGRGDNVAA